MTITLNGTTGITTPDITSSGSLNIDASAPDNSLVVTSAGNVGVGMSSPAAKLDVLGADLIAKFSATDAASGYMSFYYDTSTLAAFIGNGSSVLSGASNSDFIVRSQGALKFATNGNNLRATIDSSGNLLVGTTSAISAAGAYVKSAYQNRVFSFQNTSNVNGDQNVWSLLGSNCNTTASPHLVCDTGGTNRLIIWGNGNVVNTNNSYGAISDIKLKENVTDATPKLDKLNQVRIVNYNLIGEEQKQLGVIAQELEQIFPSMIDESPDRDAEGNLLETTTKSVKYSVFVPMLIKAIQEQQVLITQQAAAIEALTARVSALEAK